MPEALTRDHDTGYYVYGVVPAREGARPSLRGIDDAEVEFVDYGELAAAVAEIALDRPPGRRAELMAHSAVLDALASQGAVVPVQFGSILEEYDSVVHDLLEVGHDRFVGLLERLEGTQQFNLRATYLEDQGLREVVESDPAIAELRGRTRGLPQGTMHPDLVRLGELVARAMEAKRDQDANMLLEGVRPMVLDEAVRAGDGMDHLLDVALLVDTARVPEFEDQLELLAEAFHERFRLRLTGPVAPYDFAEADRWD
jgi:hypothetical protein